MKIFFLRLTLFIGIIIMILILGMVIPAAPHYKTSVFFAKIDKDSLLKNTKDNRLILVGGSNLAFGINSELLKDSLKVNPINTGISYTEGLEYLLSTVLPYVKKGDLIILSPEYNNFYGSFAYGHEDFCIMFFDIDLKSNNRPFFDQIDDLSYNQWKKVLMYYPKYISSKFSPFEYFLFKKDLVYSRNSFNKYGDDVVHFNFPAEPHPQLVLNEKFNDDALNIIKTFEKQVLEIGAHLFYYTSCIRKRIL